MIQRAGLLFVSIILLMQLLLQVRCAQIGMPTGGDKDTIAPKLVNVNPDEFATNFKGNKIIFTFNEFIEIQELQNNLLVSPLPKTMPTVDYKLKTVTVRLRDTLMPHTTYTLKFGNAIRDINEANPLNDFYYVFSTGEIIDSLTVGGTVTNAETGQPDSTSLALLYRNADDSAVLKRRPDYVAKPNGNGVFLFENLPPDMYKVYCLKDGDGGKTYNSKIEPFAFADADVRSAINPQPVNLFVYTKEKEKSKSNEPKPKPEKKLKYTTSLKLGSQDLLDDLKIIFNNPLKDFNTNAIFLADTSFKKIQNAAVNIDSTKSIVSVKYNWKEDEIFKLILPQSSFTDTMGNKLSKSDTLTFSTLKESDYGNITLRFANLDLTQNPVILFVQNGEVKYSYPVTAAEWGQKLFHSGEYDLRLLYDENRNGSWDPGDYQAKKQPEKVTAIAGKLTIRANWDNEKEIRL